MVVLQAKSQLIIRMQGLDFTDDGVVVSFKLSAYHEDTKEEISVVVIEQKVPRLKIEGRDRPDYDGMVALGARKLKDSMAPIFETLTSIENG